MRRVLLRRTAAAVTLLAALAAPQAAQAQPSLSGTARLKGRYALSGVVTATHGIVGEYPGQTVQRTWTFTPRCAAGPCRTVALTRQRASGLDHLVLHLASTNRYTGAGSFYAPVRCGPRLYRRGQFVPFTVSVQITGWAIGGRVPVATQISASYTNRKRINRTPCVAIPAHDAAVYLGSVVPGTF